ncbi:tetratricopeptide repeat-containing sensor histidine kinase [Spirosoma areae]
MKLLYATLLLLGFSLPVVLGQNTRIDSLKHLLAHIHQDTSRVLLLSELGYAYTFISSDSSMMLAQQALTLAQRIHFVKGEGQALGALGLALRERGELPQALDYAFKALEIARATKYRKDEARILGNLGGIYANLGEGRKALNYYKQSKNIYESISDQQGIANAWYYIAIHYMGLKLLDSSRFANQQAYQLAMQLPHSPIMSRVFKNFGEFEEVEGNSLKAMHYYREALRITYLDTDLRSRTSIQVTMADLFNKTLQPDSSLHYAHLALMSSRQANNSSILNVSDVLVRLYKARNNFDSAFKYQEIVRATSDSIFSRKKIQQLQRFTLAQQQRQQAVIDDQKEYQNRIQFYTLLAGLGGLLLLAYVLWRNNQQKQKANVVLEKTLTELKDTQVQLVQREKMASLGELTAGIAHEIQNPLNFVNNFSEVSTELVTELEEEQQKPNRDADLEADLLGDLKQNLQKITLHGGRASAIVKGMLEHSRSATGERLLTDLNVLCDEYLRLAYHGFRAKDKDFNAELKTDFYPHLGSIEVVPQEMGRVLLNLYNNAFYAVQQKRKTASPDYQPTVTINTARVDGHVQIRVGDNGTGIPESVKAKIFQPFFTTKPTGEGTGLGLSLSYDIITKGHGGSLLVQSQEGEGTEFTILLPAAGAVGG